MNAMSEEERMQVEKAKEAEEWKNKGNQAYKDKQFQDAINYYDQAINCNPSELTYYTNKAAVYFEMKEYDTCIELCNVAIKIAAEGYYDYQKLAKAWA